MKLTIDMDTYEKIHELSLELGRKLIQENPELRGWVESKLPELRESEDERIRKGLIRHLEELRDWKCGTMSPIKVSSHYDAWISYLEKQEQKPELVQQPPITYTYNSNASRDERLKAALLALLNSDLLKVKEGGYFTKQDLIKWVERIPIDKPAEWSEKDKENIDSLIIILRKALSKGISCEEEVLDLTDWLKSIRPQPKQMPADWTDKDKRILDDISHLLISFKYTEMAKAYKQAIEKLIYQPHWKPSDDEERLINTSISFLKDFADKGYENAVECIDWLKSKLNGNSC